MIKDVIETQVTIEIDGNGLEIGNIFVLIEKYQHCHNKKNRNNTYLKLRKIKEYKNENQCRDTQDRG